MLPQSQPRKAKNSSRVNLIISAVFHTIIIVALVYFAAREGLLGKQLKKIAVEMVKEKPPEKPKEPEKPKDEPPKTEPPKTETVKTEVPKELPPQAVATPVTAPPAVAPESAEAPSFVFSDGAKAVQTSSDPVQLYKGQLEYALRSRWDRPTDMKDDDFVAEVEVAVSRQGGISDPSWKKGSGDKRWDDAVRAAVAATTAMNRPPPTNFPERVLVRFDVQEATEPLMP